MKTRILITLTVVLFSTVSLFAQKEGITYSSIEKDEKCIKEYTTFSKETHEPLIKRIYVDDINGDRIKRTAYKWSGHHGWRGINNIDYQYTEDNKLIALTFTAWDNKLGTWANRSDFLTYIYDDNGESYIVNRTSIKSKVYDVLTQR